MLTVLCTSVGNDGFQAIHRALSLAAEPVTVVGVDASPDAYGLHLARHGHVVPSRADGPALLETLGRLCRRHQVDVLLPLSTEDVAFFARHRERFEANHVQVAVSPLASVETANDKHRLYEEGRRLGLPVPAFRHVASMEELQAALGDLEADWRPVVVKKRFSTGAQGVKVVRPDLSGRDRLFARDNIVISLDELRRWAGELDPFPPLQVSEFLPDARFSVDVFLIGGRSRCAVVRTEDRRLFGMSTLGAIVDEPDVMAAGVRTAEAFGFEYTVNVEMGRDRQGVAKVMEINPRFPATIDHTVMAGCNMPLWTVLAAVGRPFTVTRPAVGARYYRYWNSLVEVSS